MPKVTQAVLTCIGVSALSLVVGVVGFAQQPAVAPVVPPALTFVPIHPIEPPARPLPRESESANVTKFSFIAYGDTRNAGTPGGGAPGSGDGDILFIAFDSNTADEKLQLAWVTDHLGRLDRPGSRHVVAFFHPPPFSSGPHGGVGRVEPSTLAIRTSYLPLFRKHHVGLILTGHDHLYDHWVERYVDNGVPYRIDCVITGGGGAPPYAYSSEPDLLDYLAAGQAQQVRVDHLVKPAPVAADNPHHFVIVQV